MIETTHHPLELVNAERTSAALQVLQQRPVAGFCGVGNPEAFRRTLHDLGARITDFRTFPDHHAYTRADVDDLRGWARQLATDCAIVTTQKDLVKLRLTRLSGRELWAVRIELQVVAGQDTLDSHLASVFG
jgi:tetraacyldisaccharide 4'-kinase